MKESYNIYRVDFSFVNSRTETLLSLADTKTYIMHVIPSWYTFRSQYTYKGNCKLVGRITNIRLKENEKGR